MYLGWAGRYLSGFSQDAKYAFRSLRAAKTSTLLAILILAVGIGANTAVFTVLDRLLFHPLPVANPSRLLIVSEWSKQVGGNGELQNGLSFSYPQYLYLRDHNQPFSGLGAEAILAVREGRPHQRLEHPAEATAVSGNYFGVLGVPATLGRALSAADDVRSGSSHVAVLSHRFWGRRYSYSTAVLGQTLYLNGVPFSIIGVLPGLFSGVHKGRDPDVYIPIASLPDVFRFNPLEESGFFEVFGRLLDAASVRSAQSNLQVLWEQLDTARIADAGSPQQAVELRGEFEGSHIECVDGSAGYAGTQGEKRRSLNLLAVVVALVLLIACANVACLLLARGVARQQEISIRLSLGAGGRIVRQLMLESWFLALAGGAAGLLLAVWAERLLLIMFQWENRPIALSPDWRMLAFSFAASVATGVLFGMFPALQTQRVRLSLVGLKA